MLFGKVIVPLNGSPYAELALNIAEELEVHLGSKIVLLGVLESSAALYDHMYNAYLENCAEKLSRRIEKKSGTTKASIVTLLQREMIEEDLGCDDAQGELIGHPAADIVAGAMREHASIIVMVIQDYSGLWHQSLANIADSIFKGCGLPLLLIPADRKSRENNQSSFFSRIMIPLDGSAMAEHALSVVNELLEKIEGHKIELNLVHVIPEKGAAPTDYPSAAFSAKIPAKSSYLPHNKEYLAHVNHYLNEAEEKFVADGVKVNNIVRIGKPDKVITRLVAETEASLVIMASHGRSGIRRRFMGSTANQILKSTEAPVLLLRPHKPHPIGSE